MKHIKQSKQFDISIIYIAMNGAEFIMLLWKAKLINNTYKHNWNRYTITDD